MNKKYSTRLLTKEEEKELIRKAQKGDKEALDKLVLSNMGLVIKIASDSVRSIGIRSPSVSFDDVVSAGVEGLMIGLEKFDPDKGFRISTYVYWWIRQSIRRFLLTNMPFGSVSVRTAERSFSDPEFSQVNQIPISLSDDENYIEPVHEDKKDEIEFERERIRKIIFDAIKNSKKLPCDKEFCINLISLRYGLETGVPLTLRDTGEALGVSYEYVRQAENEILKILRRNKKVRETLKGLVIS